MKIKFPINNYIVFDFETTGLDPLNDHVIQMSAIKIESGKEVTKFNRFVKTGSPIPEKIVQLTGITEEHITALGFPPEKAWREFSEFIGSTFALVGHNIVGFDAMFLSTHFLTHKLPAPAAIRYIDTAMLYKARKLNEDQKYFETHYEFAKRIGQIRAFGVKYNLALCCQELGIDTSAFQAHRADSDIEMTNLIYKHFVEKIT